MNSKKLIAATAVALAAGSAFAFDVTPLEGPNSVVAPSSTKVQGKTREEVKAELREAQANGTVAMPETARLPEAAPAPSSRLARPASGDLKRSARDTFSYVLG
jgi:hypothetical protein